jgi:hypothetical protein
MPQAISPATWLSIEKAVVAGMGYSEASRAFNVSVHAIMMKSKRNHWPVASRIQQRAKALQARYIANDLTTEALAQSWAEKGEAHRVVAFNLAHTALREATKKGLPIESWRDADLADKTARRNAGLDNEERSQIEVSLALVNARLEAMDLPNEPLKED